MKTENTTTPTNARNSVQKRIIEEFLKRNEDPFDRKNIEQIYDEDEAGNKTYNKVIAQNNSWYVIPNLWPLKNSDDHFVVIAMRNNITSPTELTETEKIEFFEICKQIVKDYLIEGGAICMRFGTPAAAGTTVTHLHAHMITPQNSESVSFHIGNYNNQNKGRLYISEEGMLICDNESWQAIALEGTRDYYILDLIEKQTRSFTDLEVFEQSDLFTIIKSVNQLEKIQGGGFCMPFGDAIRPGGELKAYLISTNKDSTFEFIIKNQNQ